MNLKQAGGKSLVWITLKYQKAKVILDLSDKEHGSWWNGLFSHWKIYKFLNPNNSHCIIIKSRDHGQLLTSFCGGRNRFFPFVSAYASSGLRNNWEICNGQKGTQKYNHGAEMNHLKYIFSSILPNHTDHLPKAGNQNKTELTSELNIRTLMEILLAAKMACCRGSSGDTNICTLPSLASELKYVVNKKGDKFPLFYYTHTVFYLQFSSVLPIQVTVEAVWTRLRK